jgi:integrase/recombinase XerD
MTDEAMSPLRRRMIEDMTIRKLAPKTQQGYIRTVKDFAVFLGRSPDAASPEDVRRFQLHLAESGARTPILNHGVCAKVLLPGHAWATRHRRAHDVHPRARKLPVVLSPEEWHGCSMLRPGSNTGRP